MSTATLDHADSTTADLPRDVEVAIVGGGFGGLGAAIRLGQRGVHDYVVLERGDDVGGTWRDNSYPGCACDVQSHLYSFSFALNPDWSRSYSPQPEIQRYLQRVARDSGVLPHVRLGVEVVAATWDEAALRWRLETTRGPLSAAILVVATGPLSDPIVPDIRGLDSFAGKLFHSARWDHGYDLRGRRVAVVGTGASAIQLVPEIQPLVERLHLFQRTPPWVLPRVEHAIGPRAHALYRRLPAVQRAVRAAIYAARESMVALFRHPALMRGGEWAARRYLARVVRDPALRAKLTPSYSMGCKRVLLSNDYLPTLTRPNVEVVTAGVAEVRPHSIVGGDGVERPVDAIVLATGFRPTDPPLAHHLRGRDGRTLVDVWAGSPKAHLGTTVAGFPNLFMLLGPNTGLGHSSVVYMIEAQIEHMLAALRHMREHGIAAVEPRAEAQAAFVAEIDSRMRGTVWVAGRCRSWYLDRTGRNSTLWPDFSWRFRRRVASFAPAEYVMTHAADEPAGAALAPA